MLAAQAAISKETVAVAPESRPPLHNVDLTVALADVHAFPIIRQQHTCQVTRGWDHLPRETPVASMTWY